MAIKYTRSIPRQADVQRYEAAKALADTYNMNAGVQPDAQANAPTSEYDRERERIRNRFMAPTNDDSSAWVRSANRGQAAIDDGRQLKPTPRAGSYEFATRNLPSGTPNAPLTYANTGDTINDRGIQLMKDAGWTDEQIANRDNTPMNFGMHEYLVNNGGIDHTQAQYEAYEREKRRKQLAYEMAMRQNYGPAAAQDAMALGVPDDSGSTGSAGSAEGFDMPGNSVADYYQLDAQTYKDANPYAYHDANDPLIRGFNALRAYNQNNR